MKPRLVELVRSSHHPVQARNQVREYLQARILEVLQSAGAMVPLAFHGGTALRFLHGIDRFSEDLDFALGRDHKTYDFRGFLEAIPSTLSPEGYDIAIRVRDGKVVHSALVRFVGLLHELELTPQSEEVLAVRIEVDTRPPVGAGLETTLVRRHVPLNLQHHDRASLLAGKLHAVLQRPHTKGRDVYDLLWYMSDPDWPSPNLDLLSNALRQTGWEGALPTDISWRNMAWNRVRALDWDLVTADVIPFLEPNKAHILLTRESAERLLG